MRELTIKPINRVCGIRGCSRGPANGKRVFAIARTGEMGAGIGIMCEDCIAEAFRAIQPEEKPGPKAKAAKKTESGE